ncbi:hypothetical protein [Frigoribacterium sp. SL97]|uniref:hypothetical protein n=1 Tax=Frigoribacterium sp. SL97 TaxID=2994664 RepID=UPI00227206A1|nr:hypothetical protein [Frigoribacterium sp. SL97]WAC50234.1 hypothetical protein OVA02_10065 [Frigoribacterium sp. SL97]
MNQISDYKKELIDAIAERLDSVFDNLEESGREPRNLGDIAVLADRVVAGIPRSSPINLELGPFYTTASLTRWLGVTRQYVHELVRQRRILSLTTADRHKVYPSFQFGGKGAVLPHMPELVAIFENQLEPATQAMWLVTPNGDLGGETPAKWLRHGRPSKAVIASARKYVSKVDGDDPTVAASA